MQEFLVALACISGKGCSDVSGAYYSTHPALQEMVQIQERKIKNYVGRIGVQSAAPLMFIAAGGAGNFKIYGDFSVEIKKYTQPMFVFSKGF